jgi:hypothetical protein
MSFWTHGQSFSGKVYKTKVVVHLPSINVGQVSTPTPIPLPLPRIKSPKWGPGNFARGKKLQISRSNLAYFRAHLPCHLSPHDTLNYIDIMTQAMQGSPS